MEPDKYQQAWQAQAARTHVSVDPDLLLKEVQRNQREFRATIFYRDCIEVGAAIVLLPYWFYAGITHSLPWTWYLAVPALLWVAGFILVDRKRHPRQQSEPGEPLLTSVKESLDQVEHQIWLLRNILWWYLLPLTISILAFFAHVAWLSRSLGWLAALMFFLGLVVFLLALYSFIYYMNQRAVRVQLEPRREELLTLLASLGDESTGEHVAMTCAKSLESPSKPWGWIIIAVSCLVALLVIALAGGKFGSSSDPRPRSSGPAGDSLASLITDLRKQKNLVGLAAMVMVDGQVKAVAAHGERKQGSDVSIEPGDRWHLGGITKSITATMIARLVESGQMRWTDTIGARFPEASVHEDWKPVTLMQLLTDTAGAPVRFPEEVSRKRPPRGPECTRARREAVLNVLALRPVYPPGKKHVYSNVGYTIAGAMAEEATGATWENLVKREVFEPLELRGAGFGPPKSSDEALEQPRGHVKLPRGKFPVDDEADNTPIMGPAGAVHMTLGDLCTYATEHLRGDLGKGKLLSAETYKRLHTPQLQHYACGWIRKEPGKEIPHALYWHNGSNTMWYALVVFCPETNMVVAVTSNDGDLENAEAAAWEVVKASAKRSKVEAELPPGEESQQGPAPISKGR
jgi:CubicO group peptidase (beta-lactamase class C family)